MKLWLEGRRRPRWGIWALLEHPWHMGMPMALVHALPGRCRRKWRREVLGVFVLTMRQHWAPVTPCRRLCCSFIDPKPCWGSLHKSLRFKMTNKTIILSVHTTQAGRHCVFSPLFSPSSRLHRNADLSVTMLFYYSYFWSLKSSARCCCIIDVAMASLCLLIAFFLLCVCCVEMQLMQFNCISKCN